jgi:hypothetical protein
LRRLSDVFGCGLFGDWYLSFDLEFRGNAVVPHVQVARQFVNRKGTGQTRWAVRWKPALNAFAITFADRMPTKTN